MAEGMGFFKKLFLFLILLYLLLGPIFNIGMRYTVEKEFSVEVQDLNPLQFTEWVADKFEGNSLFKASCASNDDCSTGVCAEGKCQECTENDHWSGENSVCLTSSFTCVQCYEDGHCSGEKDTCDTKTNVCVECVDGDKCANGLIVECTDNKQCSKDKPICSENKCVQCAEGKDCSTGICNNNVCVECAKTQDCKDRGLGGLCSAGACICEEHSDCGEGLWCKEGQCTASVTGFSPMDHGIKQISTLASQNPYKLGFGIIVAIAVIIWAVKRRKAKKEAKNVGPDDAKVPAEVTATVGATVQVTSSSERAATPEESKEPTIDEIQEELRGLKSTVKSLARYVQIYEAAYPTDTDEEQRLLEAIAPKQLVEKSETMAKADMHEAWSKVDNFRRSAEVRRDNLATLDYQVTKFAPVKKALLEILAVVKKILEAVGEPAQHDIQSVNNFIYSVENMQDVGYYEGNIKLLVDRLNRYKQQS